MKRQRSTVSTGTSNRIRFHSKMSFSNCFHAVWLPFSTHRTTAVLSIRKPHSGFVFKQERIRELHKNRASFCRGYWPSPSVARNAYAQPDALSINFSRRQTKGTAFTHRQIELNPFQAAKDVERRTGRKKTHHVLPTHRSTLVHPQRYAHTHAKHGLHENNTESGKKNPGALG